MFSDVLSTLRRVPDLDAVAVVTADREAEAVAAGKGVRVLRDTTQAGQSEAALIGIRHALAEGYERVLLVPGDTPLLEPGDVAGLLAGETGVVVVPDRHGTGTNALVLAPPDAIDPSFGPGSFERHLSAAQSAGVPHRVAQVATLALDVDTPDDLAELTAALDGRHGRAPSTRGALAQLDRAGPRTSRVAQASA